jgi:4a-hydroxytetrahydrobiopterin dehydratase
MTELHEQQCEACSISATHVSNEDMQTFLKDIPEWEQLCEEGIKKLRRVYKFKNFVEAMAFSNKIAELAEEHGHHPALLTEWGKVTITWWSHEMKGLHKNDFILAAKCDHLC